MTARPRIEELEEEIVENFSLFDSWDEKYEYIIDLGKKLPALEEEHKKDENKLGFIDRIGMTTHLAQTRSNGLAAMVKQMKNFALAFKLQNEAAKH